MRHLPDMNPTHYRHHVGERRLYKALVTVLIFGAVVLQEYGLNGHALWAAVLGNLIWIWEA